MTFVKCKVHVINTDTLSLVPLKSFKYIDVFEEDGMFWSVGMLEEHDHSITQCFIGEGHPSQEEAIRCLPDACVTF